MATRPAAFAKLIEEVEAYLPGERPARPATEPVVSLRLQTPLGEVKLFTVIATLGVPLDVTAANLAIETFLPMDPSAQRGSASSARPDLPEHSPSYPARAAIATATKPDPVVIADPCNQVRCRSRAALTRWSRAVVSDPSRAR